MTHDRPVPTEMYRTGLGSAWHGDALDLLEDVQSSSVQLILTSPPFALQRKKSYGNQLHAEYVEWFKPFAGEFMRVLRDDGSLVIDIGGTWNKGLPTRSMYHFDLVLMLTRELGFHLAEEFYWYNKAKLPTPAAWVTIKRIRVKDAVNPVWWLGKTAWPDADNRRVLRKYSPAQRKLLDRGSYNAGRRPSGHVISAKGFQTDHGGAIPPNLIEVANTRSFDPYQKYCRQMGFTPHDARFPREVPEFFVKFLSKPGDLVLEPFAGSNMVGAVAQELGRRWRSFELNWDFAEGSMGRFLAVEDLDPLEGPQPKQET